MITSVILIWWYCSLSSCLLHNATYVDMKACNEAAFRILLMEGTGSVCV